MPFNPSVFRDNCPFSISKQHPVLGALLKAFESLLGINLSGVADEMSNIGDSAEGTNESVNSLKT